MKRKEQKQENRIVKYIVIGCVLLVACMSVLAGRYLCLSDKESTENVGVGAQTEEDALVKEAGAVMAQKAQFENSFSNNSDGKKVIRIVEVIPHEICSVFPYLIDWKDVETYNEKTFLGYEGIRYLTIQATKAGLTSHQYSLKKEGITRDYLNDYDVTFIQEGNWAWNIGIWRQTKMDKEDDILNVNGYFEYVGDNKGLYNINLDNLVKEGSTDLGIRYDIMAMKRKGTESKQGEWEVKDARYYWAKDYANDVVYPTGEIKNRTGYNYDLQFQVGDYGGNSAEYRIHKISVNVSDSVTPKEGYEYAAVLASGIEWTGGYTYSGQGNYKVLSLTKYLVNETTDLTDKYIRINSDSKDDGEGGFSSGYFRLYTTEDNVQVGDTVYSLTFTPVSKGEKGSYILNPAAVQSAINKDKTKALTEILFEYVGEGKGNYDIAFIYGPDDGTGALYSCTLLEVSNGDGRYALTSTESDAELLYEKVGTNKGDYSKVVTSIDCAGIDYTIYNGVDWSMDVEGYYDPGVKLQGLTMGCDANGNEYGNWVFHTVDSDELNGITKIEELENGQIPANKRIYVYGQNRKNRCYAQNGFENNEWFKLLLYLSTEDGSEPLAYQDYAAGILTPLQIKEKYATEIEGFDRAYRIEIIQRTPGELTADDVEKADLVYFGTTIGLPGLTTAVWKDLQEKGLDLPDCNGDSLEYQSDLSAEALMAIYDNCLYEKTTALLFSAKDFGGYVGEGDNVTSNLGKMAFMTNLFNDPTKFSLFIEGYPEKEEDYTTIHPDNADVTVYKQNIPDVGDNYYNLGSKVIAGDGNQTQTGDAIAPSRNNAWYKIYFRVVELIETEEGKYELKSEYSNGDGKYGYNWAANGWWNFSGLDVTESDRTWYVPYLT
ncbi:MAG: hypothetical protein ACI4ED_09855, partial [Suilimivivens sp.]